MSDPQASNELERIIKTAEVELRQIHPGLFSPEGFNRLTEGINEFIGELTVESVKVANGINPIRCPPPMLTKLVSI
jgi:hypothetical protein